MSKHVQFKTEPRDGEGLGVFFTMSEELVPDRDAAHSLRLQSNWHQREAWCVVTEKDAPEFARRLREVADKLDPVKIEVPA